MIAFVKGIVEDLTDGNVVLDVGGIGYNIKISPRTAGFLPAYGQEVKLYTYTLVREDAFSLFGFLGKEELELFKQLITVNGVGPKVALGILSAMDVMDLRFAILAQDAKKIAKAPGIGPKTAERIILDLKDKVKIEEPFARESTPIMGNAQAQANTTEAVEALTALGYGASEAMKAVNGVENAAELTTEQLLKAALKRMAFL